MYAKSRVFAVLIEAGIELHFYVMWRRSLPGTNERMLMERFKKFPLERTSTKDDLIALLAVGGVTVRYFDRGERQWMDFSEQYGLVRVPGDRDGHWDKPDLEAFERDYLPIF